MYYIENCKQSTIKRNGMIECPVVDCSRSVPTRERGIQRDLNAYYCPAHRLYLFATAWVYAHRDDNLLWTTNEDRFLLNRILAVKREGETTRFENQNSEDALTWNVIRYLEQNPNLLQAVLRETLGEGGKISDLIYWNYSTKTEGQCRSWVSACYEFGEKEGRESEPDIAVWTDNSIILIEAKFQGLGGTPVSSNSTKEKYWVNQHWKKCFKTTFEEVAVRDKFYELARFWLIGSWLAEQNEKKFTLAVLKSRKTTDMRIKLFEKHIIENQKCRFVSFSWEDIYDTVKEVNLRTSDTRRLLEYMVGLTSGYRSGNVEKALCI